MSTTPYVGYANLVMTGSPTITAASEVTGYPATNLSYEDAVHVLRFTGSSISFVFAATRTPQLAVIDRRHNIGTGVGVKLTRGTVAGTQEGDTTIVAAGKPVIIKLSSAPTTNTQWNLEFTAAGSSHADGYFEIPYVYLGSYTNLAGSFSEWNEGTSYALNEVLSDMGSVRRLRKSGKRYQYQLPYDLAAADLTTWRAVRDYAVDRPFVYALGGSHTPPDGVYVFEWADPQVWSAQALLVDGSRKKAEIMFRELPGGLAQ